MAQARQSTGLGRGGDEPGASSCIRCQWSSASSTTSASEDSSAAEPSAENFTWSYTSRISSRSADERAVLTVPPVGDHRPVEPGPGPSDP
jgi:hypothetical protein